ncbi:MAG: sugar ABC transporter permease [Lachnospiraceae bacterium]|nr:sugar ABC transporter permease [Lachnospiraceae bacterium]
MTKTNQKNRLTSIRKKKKKEERMAFAFLFPSLAGLILLSLIPTLISLYISLTDWVYTDGLWNWNFVGLKNFIDLWSDGWFQKSLWNTIIFTIVTVPAGIFLSLVIATLIDSFCGERSSGVIRIALYMPHVCNIVATSTIWKTLYSSYGPVTNLMRSLGWSNPPKFLANYTWALPAVMLVVIWAKIGYQVFLYGAAMQSLPSELYECASLDGANGIQKFRRLTIPLLANTTFYMTVTGIISSFQVFGYVNVMTGGGPKDSTYVLVYYIYKLAFQYRRTGYASAVAVILFLVLLVVTIIQYIHNNKINRD